MPEPEPQPCEVYTLKVCPGLDGQLLVRCHGCGEESRHGGIAVHDGEVCEARWVISKASNWMVLHSHADGSWLSEAERAFGYSVPQKVWDRVQRWIMCMMLDGNAGKWGGMIEAPGKPEQGFWLARRPGEAT